MNENSTTLKKTNKKSENGKLKQSLNFDDFDIQIESLLKKKLWKLNPIQINFS